MPEHFIPPIDETTLLVRLRACLNKYSNGPPDSLWTERLTLNFCYIHFTREAISLLVQLLNLPLSRYGEVDKWEIVVLNGCTLELPNRTTAQATEDDHQRCCTHDDLHAFVSALMSRTEGLLLIYCPQIFPFFTTISEPDQLEVNYLFISDESSSPSTVVDYARLGDMIHRHTQLTSLGLSLDFGQVPHELFERLSDAIHLQRLSLAYLCEISAEDSFHIETVSHLVADETGSGVVARLLQNPQSQLLHLDLQGMGLDDWHLSDLVQLLPTSQLTSLNVAENNIYGPGIVEFAQQLPRIHSLKTVILVPNPWLPDGKSSDDSDECLQALIQGMRKNYSVDYLKADTIRDPSMYKEFPPTNLLRHLVDLNRAGRRILTENTAHQLGLWPYVLERAGTTLTYLSSIHKEARPIMEEQAARKANGLYFLLQNSPIFLHRENPTEE